MDPYMKKPLPRLKSGENGFYIKSAKRQILNPVARDRGHAVSGTSAGRFGKSGAVTAGNARPATMRFFRNGRRAVAGERLISSPASLLPKA